jgi:hypothetical protein
MNNLDKAQKIKAMVDYYTNLLILQYHNKEKAKKTIGALIEPLGENIFDLDDAFDVDSAVGKQLDILGEWVGIPRILLGVDLDKIYYELSDQLELSETPISRYDLLSWGIFKRYRSKRESIYTLNDYQMRILIKLKIIYNMTDWTSYSLDVLFLNFFGDMVTRADNYDMTVTLTVSKPEEMVIFLIAKQKCFIPKGMGIAYNIAYGLT